MLGRDGRLNAEHEPCGADPPKPVRDSMGLQGLAWLQGVSIDGQFHDAAHEVMRGDLPRPAQEGLCGSHAPHREPVGTHIQHPARHKEAPGVSISGNDKAHTGVSGNDKAHTGVSGNDKAHTGLSGNDKAHTGLLGNDKAHTGAQAATHCR